jgi:hypothetical protein
MRAISAAVEGRLDPEYATRFGSYPFAPFSAFPLKRSVPEREDTLTGTPAAVPPFVIMLGMAST